MQASRASKNLIYSGGASMARSFVSGLKKVKEMYVTNHKKKQDAVNKYGRTAIGS